MKIIYFFLFILFLSNAYGFGVSPGIFKIEIKNGEEMEKEFFIYNNEEIVKKFSINGDGFFNFSDFIVEVDGNNEKEIKFKIRIPYETLEGDYAGRIYVNELNMEEGGINLDTLLGIKFEFSVNSDYELKENKVEQKIEFKAENKDKVLETKIKEELGLEIIFFYALISLVFLLGIYRVYKNIQSV